MLNLSQHILAKDSGYLQFKVKFETRENNAFRWDILHLTWRTDLEKYTRLFLDYKMVMNTAWF